MRYIGDDGMNNDTQMMKGILEGCILKVMQGKDMYGYKAVETLNSLGFEVNEATVYPILLRLQGKGLLVAERRPSPLGPDRKYYMLTEGGEDALREFSSSWNELNVLVNKVLEGRSDD